MKMKNTLFCTLLFVVLLQLPNVSFAQLQMPLELSLKYLEQSVEDLELTPNDIRAYQVSDLYKSKHNGVTHVYLNQTHNDIKVLNAILNINVLPNGEILNVGNRFVSHLQEKINGSTPSIAPDAALQTVINHFEVVTNNPLVLQSSKNDQTYIFDPTGIALDPIKVNLVYQLIENKTVRLAWMVELYQLDAQHWWNVRVDAQTGAILAHHDQVIHCNFDHPDATCNASGHHHPKKGNNEKSSHNKSNFDINSYNVFPLFIESPNHGGRELLSDPSNALASPFGWHDTDGADGPEYTITRGNNVHAYHDIFSINASSNDEPDGGSTLDFDYPLDLSTAQPYTQVDPAVVNLFYWNNIIHDLWYQYGFDEVSGNFQVNNYGNGGIAGDHVRAEGLDGGGTNNANFGTGEDGSGARMQMFIWTNDNLPDFQDPDLVVTAPVDVAGNYPMVPAAFGGQLSSPPLSGEVVLIDDGVDTGSDACEDVINGADLVGKIALIDRGVCQFGVKVLKAENEGAIGAIVCNNIADPPFGMGPGTDGALVTIPAVMISLADCNTLKTALAGLTVELGQEAVQIPMPGPTGRDGDFDNGVIVHEYGHGVSIRLTGGPSTGNCLGTVEQAGEGWSDWLALVMTTTSSNSAEEGRGIGTFAINQPTTGGGIREFPYSRSMNVNPHTYGDVPNVAVPHGVGSVWCVMIWDLYWNMVDEYGFDDDIFNGSGGNNMTMQLVIDGMKLQSCNPSFIDSRDAILAADQANYNGVNQCLIWETFARRGLGFSANVGGNEAFDLPSFCTPLQVIKTAPGEANAGDVITYSLEIRNNAPSLLSNIEVTDILPAGTSFVEGSLSCPEGNVANGVLTINTSNLNVGETLFCTYDLLIDPAPFSFIELEDDVEEGEGLWTVSSPIGPADWGTNNNSFEGDLAWYAQDVAEESDQYLELADPINLENDNPSLVFWHSYDTEATWDGGVVEITTDDGANWIDLGDNMTQNGYDGNLMVNPASPISGQPAFNGNSDGYIQTVIDLSGFSGEDIRIRFRFGCDGAVGGDGWYIDNIQFFGDYHSITNTACASATDTDIDCSEMTTVIFGDITATEDLSNDMEVSISPNPNKGVFNLYMNSTNNSKSSMNVMSVDGRLLESFEFDRSQGVFEFDLSSYNSGVYFLEIKTANGRVTKKVIIQ